MKPTRCTIEIKSGTRAALKELGTQGDTYDSLMNKMLAFIKDSGGQV